MDVRAPGAYWPQQLRTVTVVGAGTMGRDVATLAIRFGHAVQMVDTNEDALRGAKRHVDKRLHKVQQNGLLHAPVASFLGLLSTTTALSEGAKGAAVVVEAVPEILEVKRRIFAAAAEASPEALLASNTSGLPIAKIAEGSSAAERIVGTHFFNPATVMPLVEVIPGPASGVAAVAGAATFARGLGKDVVVLSKDCPGFVTTRVLSALLVASARAAETEDPAQLDRGFRELGFPMGPFEVMDLAGLDVVALVAQHLTGDVPARLRQLVAENHLGRKTGKGWFASEGPPRDAPIADPWPLLVPAIVEAAKVVLEGIASPADVDRAMRLGASFPGGPFELARQRGLDEVRSQAEALSLDAGPLSGLVLPEVSTGIEVRTVKDLTLIRFALGHCGNAVTKATLEAFMSATSDLKGPTVITGEGRFFVHPETPDIPDDFVDALRKRATVALVHGPLGEGAMCVARACRRRVARIDTAIGTDRYVSALRALELELFDAVAHPLSVPKAVTAALSTLVGVSERELEHLLYL